MAILITEAEARQMTDLHDREVLLREVHHRVKNNLQMIASIMNLQARAAQSDETKEVLSGLQRRVRGMAMLHRSLYTTTDTSQVDAQDLIAAVVSDTSSVMPDKALQIDTTLTSVMLYPDQAVPLSMWMAEALTNAVKYVGSDGEETAFIRVTLSHDGAGTVDLALENTIGAATILSEDAPTESTGLGGKLMTAFCRQLDGDVDITRTRNRYAVRLRFEVKGFDPAAANRMPDSVQPDSGQAA
jgi:two-component sensor histidine kinase